MRGLLILVVAAIPSIAKDPVVQLANASRPGSPDFQVGDRFEIVITGADNQPISVRTTRQGRTDWGPVIGSTDASGRWSTSGHFEKDDFGDWGEVWTVGGKPVTPVLHFSVGAPCLKGGQVLAEQIGVFSALICETTEGRQTFPSPWYPDTFRTLDGRVVPRDRTAEQYHMEIVQHFLTSGTGDAKPRVYRDDVGEMILNLIGPNALTEDETRNVLAIVRAAFERPRLDAFALTEPSQTLLLLKKLADSTSNESLKKQSAETVAFIQTR